jgi:hypothetical protein
MFGTESGLRVSGQKARKGGLSRCGGRDQVAEKFLGPSPMQNPAGLFRLLADKLRRSTAPGPIFAHPWHRRRRSRNAVAGLERPQPGRHLRAPTRHTGRWALLGERSVRSRQLSPVLSSSPLRTGPRPRRGRVPAHRIFVIRSQVWGNAFVVSHGGEGSLPQINLTFMKTRDAAGRISLGWWVKPSDGI